MFLKNGLLRAEHGPKRLAWEIINDYFKRFTYGKSIFKDRTFSKLIMLPLVAKTYITNPYVNKSFFH